MVWYGCHLSPPIVAISPTVSGLYRLVLDVFVRVVQEYDELVESGGTADSQGGAADVVDYSPGSTGVAALPTDKHVPGVGGTAVDYTICPAL